MIFSTKTLSHKVLAVLVGTLKDLPMERALQRGRQGTAAKCHAVLPGHDCQDTAVSTDSSGDTALFKQL